MNVKTETAGPIGIVRVGEARLMYPILADFSSDPIDIQAVYPSRRLLPPKTRVCLDFLARELPKRIARCEAATTNRSAAGRN